MKIVEALNANGDLRATPDRYQLRMIDKVQPSVTRDFKRFDEYWRGKPFIERWPYPIIPETANAYSQFIAKNIISVASPTRDVLNLRGDVPATMMVGQADNPMYARGLFGKKKEATTMPWRDPRVRIALRRAIDYDVVLHFLSNLAAQQADVEIDPSTTRTASTTRSLPGARPKGELGEAAENYLYDLAEAKRLVCRRLSRRLRY